MSKIDGLSKAYLAETIHQTAPPFSYRYSTFEWEGDPLGYIEVPWCDLRRLSHLPWPLVPYGEVTVTGQRFIRMDVRSPNRYRLQLLRLQLRQKTYPLKVKIILTLVVWGLAEMRTGEEVSWKWIRGLK